MPVIREQLPHPIKQVTVMRTSNLSH